MMATAKGHSDRGKELLEIVASVISEECKLVGINRLLEEGADVNYQDDSELQTSLHIAISNNELNIVKLLARHWASIRVNDNRNETLQLAERQECQEMVRFLTKYSNIKERMDKFVLSFVAMFEKKINEYVKEATPGEKIVKPGKTADAVASTSKGAKLFPFGKYTTPLIGPVAKCFGVKDHREKAKTIRAVLDQYNKGQIRKMAAEACFDMFRCFENQFTRCTDEKGNWRRGLEKLTEDTVSRVMNHIVKSGRKELTSSFITEGAILGESKGWIRRSGHRVMVKETDDFWNVSDLYGKVGIVKMVAESSPFYFKLKRGSEAKRCGHRLFFDWELDKWEKGLKDNYETDDSLPIVEYDYFLDSVDRRIFVASVMKIFDAGNVPKKLSGLEGSFYEVAVSVQETLKIVKSQKWMDGTSNESSNLKIKTASDNWFAVRRQVKTYFRRDEMLQVIEDKIGVEDHFVVVYGLPGVGKSQLAICYARSYYDGSQSVVWIDATTCETATNSFLDLAKELGVDITDSVGDVRRIMHVVKDVYKRVGGEKGIFIFDNANTFSEVEDFLPLDLPPGAQIPHVLITSQNSDWGGHGIDINIVPLSEFSDQEAIKFIKDALTIGDDSQDDSVASLTAKLHNLPLALQQAVNYINIMRKREKFVGEKYTICNFLEELEKNPKTLLDSTHLSGANVNSVYKTFCVISGKFKIHESFGAKALEMLNMMSFCASNDIPMKLFLNGLADGNLDVLASITDLLVNYSLISWKMDNEKTVLLTVHGLVQRVRQLELKEQGDKLEDILEKTLELLGNGLLDHLSVQSLKPHVISAWNHAYQFLKLVERFVILDTESNSKVLFTKHLHLIVEGCSFDVVSTIFAHEKLRDDETLYSVVNATGVDKRTVLHYAALNPDDRITQLLLSNKANTAACDNFNLTPLHVAARHGNLGIVQMLFGQNKDLINAETSKRFKFTALHMAAKEGHSDVVEYLLKNGATVDAKTANAYTALHLAAQGGNTEAVEILLQYKADVFSVTEYNYTPLHFAAKNGHVTVVAAILDFKYANASLTEDVLVNVKDTGLFTPLHLAAANGHELVVLRLLQHPHIDIYAKTSKGKTPIRMAALKRFPIIVAILRDHEANNQITKSPK